MSSDEARSPSPGRANERTLWAMLLTLLSGFALSQAFRTTTAILAQGLTADFGLSAQSLGAFAGLFGLSFGVAQLLMARPGHRRPVPLPELPHRGVLPA